jgi:predicted metal-dependent phosphoesterase TrpH
MALIGDMREGIQENGLCVIIGAEYGTPHGDFLLFMPCNGLSWARGLETGEMLYRVREMGGVAIAAHPCRTGRSVSEEIFARGLCSVIEIYNGRNSDEENRRAAVLIDRYDPFLCGGSDAHEPHEIGTCATHIDGVIRNRFDFIAAIRSGACVPLVGAECGVPPG